MTTALGGLRVLDQTQVMAGPFCSMLLADMGADVVKIEPPGGEHTRREHEIAPGVSASFLAVNRNKRSLVLDLKRPEGIAVLKRLVATADVLVENYRPGVARRLGVDYETLRAINPRLIYCSISGFGQTGPYADRGGYDLIAQGMSGIMSATGSDGGAPVKVGVPITDLRARLEERRVDELAAAGDVPGTERGQDADDGEEAGAEVRDRHPDLDGRAAVAARGAHDPAHALRDEIVAAAIGVRARLAEARDRAVDQPRIDRA